MEFYQQIADSMNMVLDDELICAIEGSCVTQAEWAADESSCKSRIRGALEEMTEFD